MYRVRVEGLENVPRPAARWSWPTTSVGPTACCWAWPARGIRAWSPLPSISRIRGSAGLAGWGGSFPSGRRGSRWSNRSALAREALQNGEIVCIFPEGGISRSGRIAGVSARVPVDTERYRCPGGAGLPGRAVGKHLQLRGRQVLLEMAQALALSRVDPLRPADSRAGERRAGAAGGRGIAMRTSDSETYSCRMRRTIDISS